MTHIMYYKQNPDGTVEPIDNVVSWARDLSDRQVANDELTEKVQISTVFLGMDHNFIGKGDPILWETMIFGGKHDGYQERYTSREEALIGHQKAIDLVKNAG